MTCLRKYAVFSGRAARSEFWYFTGFVMLAVPTMNYLVRLLYERGSDAAAGIADQAYSLLGFALVVPSFSVTVRRFHDTGLSGWWASAIWISSLALSFWIEVKGRLWVLDLDPPVTVPLEYRIDILTVAAFAIYAAVLLSEIIICARPSQPGPNKYGPNPQEVTP